MIVPDAGTPAGTLAVRAADLRFPGPGTVAVAGTALSSGEQAVFFRPVLSAPTAVRRDGALLADDDTASAVMLAGMSAAGADGMLVNLADTPANRESFGTTAPRTSPPRSHS